MADFQKIGRNNKNRGRKFEREVADLLGWTRVPYSGAIKEWGGADVVDGFYKKKGFWAAECKTVLLKGDGPANISIQAKWVQQMMGGEVGGRRGILIVKRVRSGGKPGVKGPRAYVFMHEDTFDWFRGSVRSSLDYAWDKDIGLGACELIKTQGKGFNFTVKEKYLANCGPRWAVHLPVRFEGEQFNWMVFALEDFAEIVKTYHIMEQDDAPDND